MIGADVQAFDADLSYYRRAATPSNGRHHIQRKAEPGQPYARAIQNGSGFGPKADVGLEQRRDTALSTWAGSTNLITLGTVTTGVWRWYPSFTPTSFDRINRQCRHQQFGGDCIFQAKSDGARF